MHVAHGHRPHVRCVVCGQAIAGTPRFANAWEKSLGIHACCGPECVGKFDVDVHWIPSEAPPRLGDDETQRFVEQGRARLVSGESPSVVSRDLLLAGVAPWVTRRLLDAVGISASDARATARTLSLMTFLGGISWWSRDRAEPREVAGAHGDVDAWERCFGK